MNDESLLDTKHLNFSKYRTFRSNSWDDISEQLSSIVSSLKVIPLEKERQSPSTIHSTEIGRIGVSQTCHGAAVNIDLKGSAAAPIVVATNIRGSSSPTIEGMETVTNGVGNSFIFDLSKTDHSSQLDQNNVQFHLILSPKLLDEICFSWFGETPDKSAWQVKTSFGGLETNWPAALRYIAHLTSRPSKQLTPSHIRHIEETVCVNLLENWAAQSGINLSEGSSNIVPNVVRLAEAYIVEHADASPTLAQIAQAANVSVRNLSLNFKKFRGTTPGQFLREHRLQSVQKALLAADHGQTVKQVAQDLNFVHMGEFAKNYRERFEELPSETLKRFSTPRRSPNGK